MDIGLIAGIAGLIAAGLGIYVMLYALGHFQYLGREKKSSIPPVTKRELLDRLLALNAPSKPYQIVGSVESDLIAEWKIVDAEWYGIFNKNGLKQSYQAFLLADETRHAVRCYEELGTIAWTVGLKGPIPVVSYAKSFFRGRILYGKEYAKGYGMKQLSPPEPGQVYDYEFDVNEIRGPIILTVEQSGWEWVPVTAKRHVTYKQEPLSPGHPASLGMVLRLKRVNLPVLGGLLAAFGLPFVLLSAILSQIRGHGSSASANVAFSVGTLLLGCGFLILFVWMRGEEQLSRR